MSKEEIIARGTRVEALLRDEDLKQAFQDVKDFITKTWQESSVEDEDGHKNLKQVLWATSLFESMLKQAIEDGKLESFNLEKKQKKVHFLGDLSGRFSNRSD